MLLREQVERAVELQARGYRLLRWMEKALEEGFIAPEAAHAYATMDDAAYAWIVKHYRNLPEEARPAEEDLKPFARLFSTYLFNSFDLDASPGERRYSPDAHCFCPMCSWMVRVPHLRPKKLSGADKRAAEKMKRGVIRSLATKAMACIADEEIDQVLRDPALGEAAGLCAYTSDLLQRLQGVAVGPSSLALWRSIAWTKQGSPKKGFTLSSDAVMAAQELLLARLARPPGE